MPLEAALLQDVRHSCIVNLLRHKFATTPQSERQLWLVMEFCDKGPLDVRRSCLLLPSKLLPARCASLVAHQYL